MSRSKRTAASRTITVKSHKRAIVPSKRRPRAAGEIVPSEPAWLVHVPWMKEAGVPVTQDTLLQVSAVYGCCRLIVDSLAPAPIVAMEDKGGGIFEAKPDDPVAYTLNYGAPVAVAPDALKGQAIEEALIWSALTGDGNGYAEIQRDKAGRFFALWPIEYWRVTPKRDETGFWYEVQQTTGGTVRVEPIDMFHLQGPSLFGWMGDSIVYRACKGIGIALASQSYAAAYFANGTVISGLLTSDKIITKVQADAVKSQWAENHGGGPSSAHGIGVTGQGIKYQPIGHNAQEAQLVESRRFQISEIARFFGVPLSLLAENEAWTNLSELYLAFYRNALKAWSERFDAEATRKLYPGKAPWRSVQHDLTSLTLGSFKDQIAALDQAVGGGLWTRDEARAVLGKNSIKGGDVLTVRGSEKRLSDALKPPAPAPAFGPKPPAPPPEEPDEDDEEEDDTEDATEDPESGPPARPADVGRVAVALDRFERAMTARRRDLEKNAPEKAEANLAEHRAKLEEALVSDLASVLTGRTDSEMRIKKAAEAVLSGEMPHLAAERLCT